MSTAGAVSEGFLASAGKIAENNPSREPFSGRTSRSGSIRPSRIGYRRPIQAAMASRTAGMPLIGGERPNPDKSSFRGGPRKGGRQRFGSPGRNNDTGGAGGEACGQEGGRRKGATPHP